MFNSLKEAAQQKLKEAMDAPAATTTTTADPPQEEEEVKYLRLENEALKSRIRESETATAVQDLRTALDAKALEHEKLMEKTKELMRRYKELKAASQQQPAPATPPAQPPAEDEKAALVAELQAKIQRLEAEKTQAAAAEEGEASRLAKEAESVRAENAVIMTTLFAKQEEMDKMKQTLDQSMAELQSAREELVALRSTPAPVPQAEEEEQAENSVLRAQLEALESEHAKQVAALQAKLEAHDQAVVNDRTAALEARIAALQLELDEALPRAQKQMAAAEGQMSLLQLELNEAKLREQGQAAELEAWRAQTRAAAAAATMGEEKQTGESDALRQAEQEAQISALRLELDQSKQGAEQELNALQAALEETKQRERDQIVQIDALQAQAQQYESQLTATRQREAREAEEEALRAQNADAAATAIASKCAELEQALAEQTEQAAALKLLPVQIATLEKEVQDAKQREAQQAQALREELEHAQALQSALDQVKLREGEEKAALQAQVDAAKQREVAQLAAMQTELDRHADELANALLQSQAKQPQPQPQPELDSFLTSLQLCVNEQALVIAALSVEAASNATVLQRLRDAICAAMDRLHAGAEYEDKALLHSANAMDALQRALDYFFARNSQANMELESAQNRIAALEHEARAQQSVEIDLRVALDRLERQAAKLRLAQQAGLNFEEQLEERIAQLRAENVLYEQELKSAEVEVRVALDRSARKQAQLEQRMMQLECEQLSIIAQRNEYFDQLKLAQETVQSLGDKFDEKQALAEALKSELQLERIKVEEAELAMRTDFERGKFELKQKYDDLSKALTSQLAMAQQEAEASTMACSGMQNQLRQAQEDYAKQVREFETLKERTKTALVREHEEKRVLQTALQECKQALAEATAKQNAAAATAAAAPGEEELRVQVSTLEQRLASVQEEHALALAQRAAAGEEAAQRLVQAAEAQHRDEVALLRKEIDRCKQDLTASLKESKVRKERAEKLLAEHEQQIEKLTLQLRHDPSQALQEDLRAENEAYRALLHEKEAEVLRLEADVAFQRHKLAEAQSALQNANSTGLRDANAMYLKNVLLSYMSSTNVGEQLGMVKAIAQLAGFSQDEAQRVRAVLEQQNVSVFDKVAGLWGGTQAAGSQPPELASAPIQEPRIMKRLSS